MLTRWLELLYPGRACAISKHTTAVPGVTEYLLRRAPILAPTAPVLWWDGTALSENT